MLANILTRARVIHYFEIFVGASVVYAGANYDHILGAHGLDAAKSLAVGAAAAGAKAVLEAWRKATRPPADPVAAPVVAPVVTIAPDPVSPAPPAA